MSVRVTFKNSSAKEMQLLVIDSSGTHNFQVPAGQTDDTTTEPDNSSFTFYWRDDGNPCKDCGGLGCNPNRLDTATTDIFITLPDAKYPKQTA